MELRWGSATGVGRITGRNSGFSDSKVNVLSLFKEMFGNRHLQWSIISINGCQHNKLIFLITVPTLLDKLKKNYCLELCNQEGDLVKRLTRIGFHFVQDMFIIFTDPFSN